MRRQKGWKQRILAWVLSAVMIAGMLPVSAMSSYADEKDAAIGESEIADEIREVTEEGGSLQLTEDPDEADAEDRTPGEDTVWEESPEEEEEISLVPNADIADADPEETREPESLIDVSEEALGAGSLVNEETRKKYAIVVRNINDGDLDIWEALPISKEGLESPPPTFRYGSSYFHYDTSDNVLWSNYMPICFILHKKDRFKNIDTGEPTVSVAYSDIGEENFKEEGNHPLEVKKREDGAYGIKPPATKPSAGGDFVITITTASIKIPMLTELSRENGNIDASISYCTDDGETTSGKVVLSNVYDPLEGDDQPDPETPLRLLPETLPDGIEAKDYEYELIPYGKTVVMKKEDITCDDYHVPIGLKLNDGEEETLNAENGLQADFLDPEKETVSFTATEDFIGSRGMIVLQPLYRETPQLYIEGNGLDGDLSEEEIEEEGFQGKYFGITSDAATYTVEKTGGKYLLVSRNQGEIRFSPYLQRNRYGYTLTGLSYQLIGRSESGEPEDYDTGDLETDPDDGVSYLMSGDLIQDAISAGIETICIMPVSEHRCGLNVAVPPGITPTVRKGAAKINPTWKDDSNALLWNYTYYLEDNSEVIVKAASNADNTVNKVTLKDDSTGYVSKEIEVAKSGEYKVKVTDKDASLSVEAGRSVKLVVRSNDETLVPKNGKYSVGVLNGFTAYLSTGGEEFTLSEGVTATVDGEGAALVDGVLSRDTFEDAGKTLEVAFSYLGREFAATIVVSSAITSLSIKGAGEDHSLSVEYATDNEFSIITIPAKADIESLEARLVDAEGNMGEEIDFGGCYSGRLNVSGYDTAGNYAPDGSARFAFFSGERRIGEIYTITFQNALKEDVKPSVKANDKESTIHGLGLTLTLPSSVNPDAEILYYEVTATASAEDREEWEDGWCNDPEYNKADWPKKTSLNDWDDKEHKMIQLYKPEVTEYFSPDSKNVFVQVTDPEIDNRYPDLGIEVTYEVKVRLIYCRNVTPEEGEPVILDESGYSDTKEIETKAARYESKLKLTNTAPKKIYSGQGGVTLAFPKYSNGTSVRKLERVVLANAAGEEWSCYYTNDEDAEEHSWWIKVDPADEEIYLQTVHVGTDENTGDDRTDYLQPGKYTVTAYAMTASGKPASASMKITVVAPVAKIKVTTSSTKILKKYNQAATVKATAELSSFADTGWKPDTKKVTWEVAKKIEYDGDLGEYLTTDFDQDDPLYGKISISQKKGTFTIAKSALVNEGSEFVIVAWTEEAGHYVYGYEHITVTTESNGPASIHLEHFDPDLDDFVDSGIKNGDTVFTSEASYAYPRVYDKNGELLDESEYTLTFSGLSRIDENDPKLKANKPGKVSLKAVAKDGSKTSATLSFKTRYADKEFDLGWVVQDSSSDLMIDNSGTDGTNPCPAPAPIYVSVYGKEKNEGWKCYINHTIKVSGGSKPVAIYGDGSWDNSVTYRIVPNARETVVTITNKTKGAADYNRKHSITITNPKVADEKNTKALKLTAKKGTIVNELDLESLYREIKADGEEDTYVPDDAFNDLYTVYPTASEACYQIPSLKETSDANVALITMAMPGGKNQGDKWTLSKYLGNGDEHAAIEQGVLRTLTRENGIAAFTVEFFEEEECEPEINDATKTTKTRYRMDRINPGKYEFYVTVGKADWNGSDAIYENFRAYAKPAKVTLKVIAAPKPKVSLKSTKLSLPAPETGQFPDGIIEMDYPVISKGYGIDPYMSLRGEIRGGKTSMFCNMFRLKTVDSGEVSVNGGKMTLSANPTELFRVKINNEEFGLSWAELKLLKQGNWGGKSYKTRETFKPAVQKKAYKTFVKENCIGYLEYQPIAQNGRSLPKQYLKFTVSIDKFLDKFNGWGIG
ncbi:MAG: hypothetical protein K6F53_11585 [Lachnospiraceae bacterium]|nr:hypothetical protein [Lachnospiraceae bacterium]